MNKYAVKLLIVALFALPAAGPSLGQEESKPMGEDKKKSPWATEENVVEIIQLAESKLYSPLRDGLKDLTFVQQVALNRQIRTYWYQAPDRAMGIFGRPVKINPQEQKKVHKLLRRKDVNSPLQQIVADRTLGWMMGKPISCLLPYGKFEIVHKGPGGTQLRFTANAMDPKNILWTNVDFYLDVNFLLTKYMEKMITDGRIEEYRVTLKPVGKDAKLLVLDTAVVIAGTEKFQKSAELKYKYAEINGFWLPEQIEYSVASESKKYLEKFMEYKVNQGVDDAIFKKEEE